MENKNIIVLRHHPIMNLKKDNPFYVNQLGCSSEDYLFFDVTSRVVKEKEIMKMCPSFAKDCSPFFLGPVTCKNGKEAYVFEHFWQCQKVYPCFVDEEGNVREEYFAWRDKWFDKKKAEKGTRHPEMELGYKSGDCVFAYYYNGKEYEKLTYIESRKRIYIPEYCKLFVKTEAYKLLKQLVSEGKKICLLDFDGYNFYNKEYKDGLYKGINNMKDVVNNPKLLAGQGFIIKMLLQGDLEVVDDEVIDHSEILK